MKAFFVKSEDWMETQFQKSIKKVDQLKVPWFVKHFIIALGVSVIGVTLAQPFIWFLYFLTK